MKTEHGFTVIELLIGVAVASVLLALAAPSFSALINSYRLTTLTNDVIAATNLARSEAIKRNRSVTLCRSANADANACANADGRWNNWIIVAPVEDVIRRGAPGLFASNVRISSAFNNDGVTFAPDGTPSENAAITLCTEGELKENLRTISIGPGNRVSTLRSTVGTCP